MKQHTITESVSTDPFQSYGLLDTMIDGLLKIRDSIPEEFRSKAYCEIDSEDNYGDSRISVRVYYTRPLTKDEEEKRRSDERQLRTAREATERAEYQRLRMKYGMPKPDHITPLSLLSEEDD